MQVSENISNEILNLEKKYWAAMQNADVNTALALTDFPCVVVSSHGASSVDKEQFEKMFKSTEGSIKSFKFDDAKAEVRQVGADTAIIAYPIVSTFIHDGQEKTVHAVDTSTWIRKGNKWVCAMHTETNLLKQ